VWFIPDAVKLRRICGREQWRLYCIAGLLVGSLDILGSPTGLVRNIGNGVADMFGMPYRGLMRGPGEFLDGVRRGTGSLLWHLSTGFLVKLNYRN